MICLFHRYGRWEVTLRANVDFGLGWAFGNTIITRTCKKCGKEKSKVVFDPRYAD